MTFAAHLAAADGLALRHLGEAVVYRPSLGSPVTVTAIFELEHRRDDATSPQGYRVGPAAFLREADLLAAGVTAEEVDEDGGRVTVGAVEYRVRERVRDGLGGLLLVLHAAGA